MKKECYINLFEIEKKKQPFGAFWRTRHDDWHHYQKAEIGSKVDKGAGRFLLLDWDGTDKGWCVTAWAELPEPHHT